MPEFIDLSVAIENNEHTDHPGGSPKRVSLRQNFIAARTDEFLHYMTDTEPGSSGSPVFDDV